MTYVTRNWLLNGDPISVNVPPGRRLLDVIREDIGQTGAKEGCGEGECGACTVLVDGKAVLSCLMPAGQVPDHADLTTVEGLERTEGGRVLQRAYIEKGAAQCGICIPGMIVSSYALLAQSDQPPDETLIRESHAGNICRCTGYAKIVEAIQYAGEQWPRDEQAADPISHGR